MRHGGTAPRVLASGLDGGEWLTSRSSWLIFHGADPGVNWAGGLAGPGVCLVALKEIKTLAPV